MYDLTNRNLIKNFTRQNAGEVQESHVVNLMKFRSRKTLSLLKEYINQTLYTYFSIQINFTPYTFCFQVNYHFKKSLSIITINNFW